MREHVWILFLSVFIGFGLGAVCKLVVKRMVWIEQKRAWNNDRFGCDVMERHMQQSACRSNESRQEEIANTLYLKDGDDWHLAARKPYRWNAGVEVFTAMLFVSLVWQLGISWELGRFTLLGCLLIIIAFVDDKTWIIPDSLLLLGLLLYLPFGFVSGESILAWLFQGLLGGCSVAVPLFLFVLAADFLCREETMGGGDLKLFFLLGVYFGPLQTVLLLFFSCLIGLLWQLLQNQLAPGKPFPFGPSIALASWITVLWGPWMAQWYWHLA